MAATSKRLLLRAVCSGGMERKAAKKMLRMRVQHMHDGLRKPRTLW